MTFDDPKVANSEVDCIVPPRSMYVMTGNARYELSELLMLFLLFCEIQYAARFEKRKYVRFRNVPSAYTRLTYLRKGKRVSATFRTVRKIHRS